MGSRRTRARAGGRWSLWRRAVQLGFLGVAAVAAVRWTLGLAKASPEASCPFGAIEMLAAQVREGAFLRNLAASNWIALGLVLASAVLFGRVFCGWACPIGTLQDGLASLSRRIYGKRGPYPVDVPRWLDIPLRWLKMVVLGWVLWGSITALVPPLAPYCPFRTVFAPGGSALLSWGLMATLALLSMMVERFWCRYLCPLAPVLALFNRISPVRPHVDSAACVRCGRCKTACPAGIDPVADGTRHVECIRCMNCAAICPRADATRVG